MFAWLALFVGSSAAAPSTCEPYRGVQFRVDLAMITDAIVDGDFAEVRSRLGQVGERLPCSNQVVDHRLFAKFARYMALSHHTAQDDVGATRWLLSSKVSAPKLPWNDAAFPPDHALRKLERKLGWPAPGPLEHGLRPPRNGGIFLNGQLALDASAPEGVPYLAQAFDRKGRRVDAWWQEGGTFPADYLAGSFRDVSRPRWWRPAT
ncbi:MAG: hypothetical protein AAGA48_21125 [Myxococcota bacterium]